MKQVVLACEHNAVDHYLGRYHEHQDDAEHQKKQGRIYPVRFVFAASNAIQIACQTSQKTPKIPHQTQSAKATPWICLFAIPSKLGGSLFLI
jgi:hypothetical protein